MGVLDELKNQAQAKLSDEEKLKSRQEQQEQHYREHVSPSMVRLYRYLKDLTDQLNVVNPEVMHAYEFPGIGPIDGFKHSPYEIRTDSETDMRDIQFFFQCTRMKPIMIRLDRADKINHLHDFLHDRKIQFNVKKEQDTAYNLLGATFNINPLVFVMFNFSADLEAGNIRLLITNFDELGTRKIPISPDQIDDGFLDNLGNFILRKTDQFMKQKLSDEQLAQIRKRLAEEQKVMQTQIKQHEEEERQEMLERKKKSKIGGLLNKIKSKVQPETEDAD